MTKPPLSPQDRVVPGDPPELIVYDRLQPCPYLDDRVARMPLRIPARVLDREELERRLSSGDRRQGIFLYRTSCPGCQACEPIRIEVAKFHASRAQRRVLERGDRSLSVEIAEPLADERRVALYNAHKEGRGLSSGRDAIDLDGYREFLAVSCCETFELRYSFAGQLVGVALVDRSREALSAVYCYYDPRVEKLSIGTFSILKQVELCRLWRLEYLYLGLYIADSPRMRYKARFRPHQRRINGQWLEFAG
ncbi:MAG TPA: arginyltransferase [Polyangiaceae bacterium]|jgi:arginine-tRNA-protein transferase